MFIVQMAHVVVVPNAQGVNTTMRQRSVPLIASQMRYALGVRGRELLLRAADREVVGRGLAIGWPRGEGRSNRSIRLH